MTEEIEGDTGSDLLPVVWTLLTAAWVLGPPVLMLNSWAALPLFGGVATDAQLAESHTLRLWAVAVAIGVPLIGLVAAAIARRRQARCGFAIILVVSTLITGVCAEIDHREHWRPPAPTTDPHPHCVERSGGGNECPGD